ncbi:MAG: methyltransferase domain-containing protein [Marinifilaceae bacterium]|jgi:SAM-dependent methyltransferase|nr:methyltransferase domain-containing protein [Marinifilaceae bacterium]
MKKSSFDQYAGEYDSWFFDNTNLLYSEAKLVAHFLNKSDNIFSVGCGSGLFESILKKDWGIEIKNGIEPSTGMAEIARKRGINVAITTAENAEFEEGVYDTILFNGTPSYITDLDAVIQKVYKALKPGGKVVMIDVPKEGSYALMYNLAKAVDTWDHPLLEGVTPRDPYPIEFVRVANWRTTKEKVDLLEKAGFVDFDYAQTLTKHPMYSNNEIEEVKPGFDCGDYVAICAFKK